MNTKSSPIDPTHRELRSWPPSVAYLYDPRSLDFVDLSGFSEPDQVGRWSNGPTASATFTLPENVNRHVLLKIQAGVFAGRPSLPEQVVSVGANVAKWVVKDPRYIGAESRKSFDEKVESDFWKQYMLGPKVPDIGFKGAHGTLGAVPIAEGAIGTLMEWDASAAHRTDYMVYDDRREKSPLDLVAYPAQNLPEDGPEPVTCHMLPKKASRL